jgi:hypothetical protein
MSDPVLKKYGGINVFHKMLMHCNSNRLEKAGKIHDLKLCREFKTHEGRAIV